MKNVSKFSFSKPHDRFWMEDVYGLKIKPQELRALAYGSHFEPDLIEIFEQGQAEPVRIVFDHTTAYELIRRSPL